MSSAGDIVKLSVSRHWPGAEDHVLACYKHIKQSSGRGGGLRASIWVRLLLTSTPAVRASTLSKLATAMDKAGAPKRRGPTSERWHAARKAIDGLLTMLEVPTGE